MPKTKESAPRRLPRYLAITPRKLAILSIGTFGFYQLYWFYKQWVAYSQRTGQSVWAVPRAIFAEFICYPLFDEVAAAARERTGEQPYSSLWAAIAFFCLSALAMLPAPLKYLGLLSVVPLLQVQEAMNGESGVEPSDQLTNGQVVLVVIGFVILGLSIFGSLFKVYES